MHMKKFRENGAKGALLDEYEKAILELQKAIEDVTPDELVIIVDHETKNQNCKSIQSILTHVIRAGHNYARAVRRSLGEQIDFADLEKLNSIQEYQRELGNMFKYNEKLFDDYPDVVLEEIDNQKKILVTWGQLYDIEQLFEHAIVHVLRHRRQIERFLIKLRSKAS
jgi:uncharacterized damage-inducible protein DinB